MSERVTTEQARAFAETPAVNDLERMTKMLAADLIDAREDLRLANIDNANTTAELHDARAEIDRLRGVVVARGRIDTYDYKWRDEIMAAIRGTKLGDGKRQVEVVIREVAHE